ncbi:MAG TPA: CpXC domain-containing protein [Kofleriaceae bacterium]|nr:CpXC domain-containing protein [Kofleriaceae bacterium]
MSYLEPARVRCACGTELDVMAADSLHVTNLPEVRDQILRGELHVFRCPACGARVQLDKLLAYTDFDRWHWFTVFPEAALDTWQEAVQLAEQSFASTLEERSAPIVKTWSPKFRTGMRAVFGMQALREKLMIADAGLDDRTIEALKLQLLEWYELPYAPGAHLWFSRIEDDQLVFAWATAAGPGAAPPVLVAVPFTAYQRLAIDRDTARALAPVLADSIAVDFRIARPTAAAASA